MNTGNMMQDHSRKSSAPDMTASLAYLASFDMAEAPPDQAPHCAICLGTRDLCCVDCVHQALQPKWNAVSQARERLRRAEDVSKQSFDKTEAARMGQVYHHRLLQKKLTQVEERLKRGKEALAKKKDKLAKLEKSLEVDGKEILAWISNSVELQKVIESGLEWYSDAVTTQWRVKQWQKAIGVLRFYVVSQSEFCSIMHIPLPSETSHWSSLPSEVVLSALRLIAQCVHAISQCLCIPLPHPIMLNKSKGHCLSSTNPPNDSFSLAEGIVEGICFEDSDPSFVTAVKLLQINIINLCIRADVEASTLHPEGMLANLVELQKAGEAFVQKAYREGADLPLLSLDEMGFSFKESTDPPAPPNLSRDQGSEEWEAIDPDHEVLHHDSMPDTGTRRLSFALGSFSIEL